MRFFQQCLAILVVLAAATQAMPAEVEKRSADGEVGDAVVVDEPEALPDIGEEKRAADADIGTGVVLDEPAELPDLGGGIEKRGAYYYSYDSSTSMEPELAEEIVDHGANGGQGKAPGCLPEYAAMEKANTMCAFEDDPDVTEYGLSEATINEILDKHNEYRAGEPAKDMTMMRWDPNIAVIAQKLAQSCHKGHDENYNRLVPGYNIPIGQNWCGGVKTWGKCMELWYNEKTKWKYGKASKAMIGHFTQIVNKKATHVGCGYAYCSSKFRQNMVCNYAFGQTSADIKKPYIKGSKCKMCAGFCDTEIEICDCGDKLCKNNGKLNKETCQCDCIKPYTGDTCSEVDCSEPVEHRACGRAPYIADNCSKYTNLAGMCKVTCGVCPAPAK